MLANKPVLLRDTQALSSARPEPGHSFTQQIFIESLFHTPATTPVPEIHERPSEMNSPAPWSAYSCREKQQVVNNKANYIERRGQ